MHSRPPRWLAAALLAVIAALLPASAVSATPSASLVPKLHAIRSACAVRGAAGFAHCNSVVLADANASPLPPPHRRLRPVRPPERVRARRGGVSRWQPDRRHRRCVRRQDGRSRCRCVSLDVRPSRLHDGERLLQEVNQNGVQGSYPTNNQGGARGQPRPRHGVGGVPEVPHPPRRSVVEREREPLCRGRHGRSSRSHGRLEQLRRE